MRPTVPSGNRLDNLGYPDPSERGPRVGFFNNGTLREKWEFSLVSQWYQIWPTI